MWPTGEWGPQAAWASVWLVKWLPGQWVHGPGPHSQTGPGNQLSLASEQDRERPLGSPGPVFLSLRLSLGSRFMSHSLGLPGCPIYNPHLSYGDVLAFSVSVQGLALMVTIFAYGRLQPPHSPCPSLFHLPIQNLLSPINSWLEWGL